ncbi:MAG TPA: DUF547 domain-containing protein [Abditibacteriaceae bacterium]|jgi:hypothetical protein
MNRILLFLAAPLAFAPLTSHAQDTTDTSTIITTATPAAEPTFSQGILFPYSLFDRALETRVSKTGTVDYSALKANPDLDRFLLAVATADTSKFPVFQIAPTEEELKKNRNAKTRTDRSTELVFWINAYNAHVLKAISDAYPINSPDEIKDFDTAPRRVANQNLSFAEMRAKIAQMDRRALFAITDGTQGGPLMNPKAYRWSELNALLDNAASSFINGPDNVAVTRIANRVEIAPYLVSVNQYFVDGGISGGAERRKLTGVRYLLSTYADKRAERSYLTGGDYMLQVRQPNRRLNMEGLTLRKLD